jgi:hypothetical protein
LFYTQKYKEEKTMSLKKIMENIKNKQFKVVKVFQTEFELEDGSIYPILFKLDYTPTVKEFQKMVDNSKKLILNLINDINGTTTND